jgi:hypothetical protein
VSVRISRKPARRARQRAGLGARVSSFSGTFSAASIPRAPPGPPWSGAAVDERALDLLDFSSRPPNPLVHAWPFTGWSTRLAPLLEALHAWIFSAVSRMARFSSHSGRTPAMRSWGHGRPRGAAPSRWLCPSLWPRAASWKRRGPAYPSRPPPRPSRSEREFSRSDVAMWCRPRAELPHHALLLAKQRLDFGVLETVVRQDLTGRLGAMRNFRRPSSVSGADRMSTPRRSADAWTERKGPHLPLVLGRPLRALTSTSATHRVLRPGRERGRVVQTARSCLRTATGKSASEGTQHPVPQLVMFLVLVQLRIAWCSAL